MERDTKTFKTKHSDVEVVVKSWLSAGEKRAVNLVAYGDIEIDIGKSDDKKTAVRTMKLSTLQSHKDEMVKQVVVSVSGVKTKVLDQVLSLRSEDSDEIYEVAGKIYNDEDFLDEDKK